MTTHDRLSVEWEKLKHTIPDGELKVFLCRAVMMAMEKWSGGEPPQPKVLRVEVIAPCEHRYVLFTSKGDITCTMCGHRYEPGNPIPDAPSESVGHPVSPYAGGGIG